MEHHPIVSNSLLCFNLWIAGDTLAQYSEYRMEQDHHQQQRIRRSIESATKNEEEAAASDQLEASSSSSTTTTTELSHFAKHYQVHRTAQCASYGAFFTGPIIATWYPFLEKLCTRYQLTARYGIWAAPIAKVWADEFLMDPPTLVAFYGYMNLCEGGNWDSFRHKLSQEFLRSWMTSLAVWPVVLLGTFRYLPVYAQAPWINACCIVWDGFLSHRNAAARIQQQQQRREEDKQEESKASKVVVNNHQDEDGDHEKI